MSFLCPHCKGQLKIEEQIIFSTQNERKEKGLIILSAKVGDYTVLKHESYEFYLGEKVEFFCPLCMKNLVSDLHPNLCMLLFQDNLLNTYKIYFSSIVGEKSTYVVSDDTFEAHGPDNQKYIELFYNKN